MAENKKSFVAYADWMETFEYLTDEEAGKLIKHLLRYVNDLNPITDDRIIEMSFIQIKLQLKRDLDKWEETKGKRSKAGKESARLRALKKKQQTSTNPTRVESVEQTSTNPTVTVNDTVNVTVTDNVNDIINNNKYKISTISDLQFMEITAQQTKQTIPRLLQYLETFENHLIQIAEQKDTLKDFKQHFTNWLNKQDLKKGVKYKKQRYV